VFLPWKDDLPTRRVPWVTIGLITTNAVVFAAELAAPDPARLFREHGLVPAALTGSSALASLPTLATSLFLHGSLLHLASNALYLWIFGNNVEDTLGPFRFTVFYALAGLGAHGAQILSAPASVVPTVGASGAIAGILGAYLLRFPTARVHTFLYLIFVVGNFRVPAAIVIAAWLVLQVVGGLGSLAGDVGGIAWFEHLGGFATGVLLFPLLAGRRGRRVARW
jgi:membrane associated rhomboid family serine protease